MRAAQSLLALIVFIVFAGVQQLEVVWGLIAQTPSNCLTALNLVGAMTFFGVVRSGGNERFVNDPSLTFAQCLFGICSICVSYSITGPARGAVLGIAMLILVFAMFALRPKSIRILALVAFSLLAMTMLGCSLAWPQRYPPHVEVIHLMFALIVVSAVAVLSARMGSLRERLRQQKDDLSHALEQNRRLATLDDLTGLVNRRHMTGRLAAEIDRQRRSASRTSVALIDIDLFKRINDNFGHAAGDSVLKVFACLASEELRCYDCVSRWGGEEFLVLMPDTDSAAAHTAIERLRAACARLQWPAIAPGFQVTFSAGIATTLAFNETPETIVERADGAMYLAKQGGRNQVRTACPASIGAAPEQPVETAESA